MLGDIESERGEWKLVRGPLKTLWAVAQLGREVNEFGLVAQRSDAALFFESKRFVPTAGSAVACVG